MWNISIKTELVNNKNRVCEQFMLLKTCHKFVFIAFYNIVVYILILISRTQSHHQVSETPESRLYEISI